MRVGRIWNEWSRAGLFCLLTLASVKCGGKTGELDGVAKGSSGAEGGNGGAGPTGSNSHGGVTTGSGGGGSDVDVGDAGTRGSSDGGDGGIGGSFDDGAAGSPVTGECGDIDALSQIGRNEGPFRLCSDDSDCDADNGHECYENGGVGFCHVPDPDTTCDGGGDINIRTVPMLPGWGPGICVPTDWWFYLCCAFPDHFDCDAEQGLADCVAVDVPGGNGACEAVYECEGSGLVEVQCDGEEDGTNTSLCTCRVGSESLRIEGLFPSEGPLACKHGAARCHLE